MIPGEILDGSGDAVLVGEQSIGVCISVAGGREVNSRRFQESVVGGLELYRPQAPELALAPVKQRDLGFDWSFNIQFLFD